MFDLSVWDWVVVGGFVFSAIYGLWSGADFLRKVVSGEGNERLAFFTAMISVGILFWIIAVFDLW